jgi:hypothetical protein
MEKGAWFLATYDPRRPQDLEPAAAEWIGWRGLWVADHLIEDGPYEGEFACVVKQKHRGPTIGPPPAALGFVPHYDLEPINLTPEQLAEVEETAIAILKEKGARGELRGQQ